MKVKTLPSGKKKWTCPYCGEDIVQEEENIKRDINGHIQNKFDEAHGGSRGYPKDWMRHKAERIGYSGFTCAIEIERINEDAEVVASVDLFGTKSKETFPIDDYLSESELESVERVGDKLHVTRCDNETEIIINLPSDLL